MTQALNLSFTELTALLRDVCKVTYGQDHDYVQIADTLVWMEVHGFSGLKTVLQNHAELRGCPFSHKNAIGPAEWDVNGESLVPLAYMVGDMMLTNLVPGSRFVLSNAGNIAALFPEMLRVAHSGVNNCLMNDGKLIAESTPDGLTLFVDIPYPPTSLAWVMGLAEPQAAPLKSSSNFESQNKTALLKGIPLSKALYDALCKCAAETLVPATEQSRRGAGD